MKNTNKEGVIYRLLTLTLCAVFAAGLMPAAFAVGETETAANYLVQQGIFKGDGNGNLNLDKGLTRAELAVILTRLDFAAGIGGLAEWDDWGEERFTNPEVRYNTFTDIPSWAFPYVEYCYQLGYMKGVAATRFDPQGSVTPKMACTVMLRYCRVADTDWDYNTSVEKAQNIGIAPVDGMNGNVILRGTMAVIIYRSIQYAESGALPNEPTEAELVPSQSVTPAPDETAAMTIEEMKAEIVRLTNEERVKAGLPELKVLPELMDCAQAKADDMRDNHYYGHKSPVYGTSSEMIRSFIPKAGWTGENLAPWTKTPQEAFVGWVASTGHLDNILDTNFTHIGIGIITGADGGYWWVQQFISLR